ncbi:MAG: DUF4367 domain-containing protein [Ruminococcus flavefaciens]|nr:DUF4367 domain-containing protein [Ruminococcus flavefaciens]MCM1230581.1 DUF4367 domain-containing protein [Ruminococcus flavefaciens]
MEKKDIILKVLAEKDSFQSKSTSELRETLDKELSNPDEQTDYELVDELTTDIIESEDKERLTADVEAELDKLKAHIPKYGRVFRFKRIVTVLSAACVVLFCMNCVTVSAWNVNIVSVVINFTEGGFYVDFGQDESEITDLITSEDDPYGIRSKCAEYDIYPTEVPHYIPEGFKLTHIDTDVNKNYSNMVSFIYQKGNQDFSIDYTRYWDKLGHLTIPSDHYNLSETEVNGYPAVVSKEDKQYTITYQTGKTIFLMFARNVPYDECDKIVESIY